MKLEIITPDVNVFSDEVKGGNFPGIDGSFEVLTNHAAMISALGKGIVRVYTNEGEKRFTIDGGILEVLNNKIIVLAESVLS